jgi:farnesyl-diphosphate farnesyltransferase
LVTNILQIEQFIETLFPKQDPKKLALTQSQKENKEPGMDAGEAAVLFGVVIAALVCISGLMVRNNIDLHATLH